MIIVAWILLMLGLVVSSLAASRIDDHLGVLALLTDPSFLGGIGAIVVSIVLNRLSVSSAAKSDQSGKVVFLNAQKNVEEILRALNGIAQNRNTLPLAQVVQQVDGLLKNQVFDIAESRIAMIQTVGYGPYAEFMSDFAIGERFISRTWSAGVDKYPDESLNYVEKAIPFMEKAGRTLVKISSANV
jgi:hypothetical protein